MFYICSKIRSSLKPYFSNKINLRRSKANRLARAFTLIELMISVAILSVGIVFILRSFLSNVSALDSGSNYIRALQFLDQKLVEVEHEIKREKGIELGTQQGEVMIGARPALWTFQVLSLENEEKEEIKDICKVKITLTWREAGKSRQIGLATYCPAKQTQENP